MDVLSNLRIAYRILEDRVINALRTQIGDSQRLCIVRDEALTLRAVIQEVRQHRLPITLGKLRPLLMANFWY
jgi:hypothetical protein